MKKIGMAIGVILLTISVVSAGAYALFFDTVQVQGISISTGRADIKINNRDDVYNAGVDLKTVMGGDEKFAFVGPFMISNESDGDIKTRLTLKLESYGGDWDILKNKIKMRLTNNEGANYTEYLTLEEWTSPVDTGVVVGTGENKSFRFDLLIDDLPNEAAGKSVNNLNFVVTGTQQ